ncbi:hypothetical protein [Bosea caraganae]|nr:hypothetical protein [Bosea caraganae]
MNAALPHPGWRRRVHLIVDFGTGDDFRSLMARHPELVERLCIASRS